MNRSPSFLVFGDIILFQFSSVSVFPWIPSSLASSLFSAFFVNIFSSVGYLKSALHEYCPRPLSLLTSYFLKKFQIFLVNLNLSCSFNEHLKLDLLPEPFNIIHYLPLATHQWYSIFCPSEALLFLFYTFAIVFFYAWNLFLLSVFIIFKILTWRSLLPGTCLGAPHNFSYCAVIPTRP